MALTPKNLARRGSRTRSATAASRSPTFARGAAPGGPKVAHHVTYEASGLDVVFLCRSCHTREHKRLRRGLSPAFRSLVSKAPPHPS
jgi:hypothetical protein